MKKFYLFLLLLLCVSGGYSQRKDGHVCGADELHLHLSKDKAYQAKTEKINHFWRRSGEEIKTKSGGLSTNSVPPSPITLQIVFHDMNTGVSTLDYPGIVSRLNTIYSGGVLSPMVANGATLPNKPGMADTQIRFCLALQDINGNTYTAAESQHFTSVSSFGPSNEQAITTIVNNSQSTSGFPTTKYINIYIVNDISGNTAGFATMPFAHGTLIDGIYIERKYLTPNGPNGTNLNYNMNVLAHEMGHFLGLFHTFGICDPQTINDFTDGSGYNACSCNNDDCLFNGDMVCDTPPNMLIESGYTCIAPPNSCSTDNMPFGPSDVADDKGNYMDYGNYYCQNHFTTGQAERMHFMIDPVTGPRKSLIATSCTNCNSLDNCSFSISTNITANQAVQGSTTNFNAVSAGGCGLSGSGITYTWSLQMAGTSTPLTATGVNYSPSVLATGNYVLTLKASNASNPQCFELTTYTFEVVPVKVNCHLSLPASNSNWGDWERVSYQNGWSRNLNSITYPYTYPNTVRTELPAGPDTGQNFDIFPATSFNDPNFAGISVPAGLTRIMRVGPKLGNGNPIAPGNGSYVSVTFHPTADNCKFRIHSLGLREAAPNQYVAYLPAINAGGNSTAAFGYVCQYLFDSPVNSAPGQNTTLGMSENGLLLPGPTPGSFIVGSSVYGLNDMVSERHNSAAANFVTVGTQRRMNQWTSQVLDFSEFVNLDTDITITFFAHTNDAVDALYSAYSYFGIECLGGGVPDDITMNLPDMSLGCAYQAEENCVEIPLPRPAYAVNSLANGTGLSWLNLTTNNLAKITVSKLEGGIYVPVSTPPQLVVEAVNGFMEYSLRICLNADDEPFADYRVELITLNKTITDDFRVFKGFFYNDPPCPQETVFGGKRPEGVQQKIVWCPGNTLSPLTLTDPCFGGSYQYQWFVKDDGQAIPGATQASLEPAQYSPYIVHCSRTFVRKVLFKDPYCGAENWLESETYTVYNLGGLIYQTHNITKNDVCLYSNNTTVNVTFTLTSNLVCTSFSPPPGLPSSNSVTAQLMYGLQPVGTPLVLNYVGNPPFFLFENQSLSFDNNTPNGPILGVGSHALTLKITSSNYGCVSTSSIGGFVTINVKASPIGGKIQLDHECVIVDITSTDHGVTNPAYGYAWEYAQDPAGPFLPVPGASNGPTLSGFNLAPYTLPLYMRRKSFGFDTCPDDVYSNVIQVNAPQTTPAFSFPLTICSSQPGPVLPLISDNGIAGTWSPAVVNNIAGQIYTFTPNADQCTNRTVTVTTTVVPIVTPFFSLSEEVCTRHVPMTLPTVSNNGVAGTWNPPVIQASGTYTFTPSDPCNASVTLTITVSSEGGITLPYFTNLQTVYCQGEAASPFPTVSTNGHTGTWNIAAPDTSVLGTVNYIFTSDQGACSFAWIPITVVAPGTPTFDITTVICPGDPPSFLPYTSLNGIPGTWSPSYISPVNSGSYTFTPSSSCNPPVTIDVHVLQECTFQLYWSSDVSCQQAGEGPRQIQDIADGQCIRVCENSTIQYYLGGANISTVDWIITGGTLVNQSPNGTAVEITWSQADFCALQGTIHRTNGTQVTFEKCIEKLSAPRADFMIMPGPGMVGCLDSPVHFKNLTTTSDGGSDILYYNWDFGDGHTSTEFEPSHTYTGIGTYTVRLTVFNGCSCISSRVADVQIMEHNTVPITCEGVVCEGQTGIYAIPQEYSGCDMEWSAVGGEVVWYNNDKTKAEIFWNQTDESGFGYVSVYSSSCFPCASTLKIPVVKQQGTISGTEKMCANSQSIYSLPKWPTTEFNWELLDGGTGADLRYNNQRNEVIVNSGTSGEMKLKCTYFNTLLRCGGTAMFVITVKPKLNLSGPVQACTDAQTAFELRDESSNPMAASWEFTGPNGFVQSGTSSTIAIEFPEEGIYNFTVTDPEYCSEPASVKVFSQPGAPEAIEGPMIACSGVDVDYSCLVPEGYTAVWEVQNGSFVGLDKGETVRIKFNDTSDPYVVKVAFSQNDCTSEQYAMTVQRILPNLNLAINNPEVCGSSYAIYKVADNDMQNYTWSIEPATAGSVSEGQNEQQVTVLWNQTPQNATLHLAARKCGVVYQADYPVTITGGPSVSINGPTTVCNASPATFTLSFSTPVTFTSAIWDFGNGDTATVLGTDANPNSVSVSYDFNSESDLSYTVSVKVEGANGCGIDLIDTFDIVVTPSPLAYISPSSINLCGKEPGFQPVLSLVQESLGGTASIQWYKSGYGLIQGQSGSTLNTSQHGDGWYYAVLTNTVNCTTQTGSVRVAEDCDEGQPGCGVEFAPIVNVAVLPSDMGGFKMVADIIGLEYGGWPEVVEWSITGGVAGGFVEENNNFQYIVHNLNPGQYTLTVKGKSQVNGTDCYSWPTKVDFLVPYKPALYARTACMGSGMYEVELIDYSDYLPPVEIDDWKFAVVVDPNNINWAGATFNANNIASQTWGLPPGQHVLGIKISGSGHPAVENFITVDLPAYPNPQFTFDTACEGEATHFTVTNPVPGWSYLWNFGNGVTNSQQDAAMTFTGSPPFPVTLTVSNDSECGGFATGSVNIHPVNLEGGSLSFSPATACDGSPITITYTPGSGGTIPSAYHWYKEGNNSPIITSTPTLAVTQGGIYRVEIQDSNGCLYTQTPSVNVSFIPSPQPPSISGDGMICFGETTSLSVDPSTEIYYTWYLNGSQLMQWNNASTIEVNPPSPGNYQYSCIAMSSENGVNCYSQPSFFSVEVFPLPLMPEIVLSSFSCDPYEAVVKVSNPQPDTTYYWSNGQTGTTTTITHDGPIQVRAELNTCTVTTQIDLPVDLQAVAWVFPKGCFDACRPADAKEIVGPAGDYPQWSWMQNHSPVISGGGPLSPFDGLTGGNDYQLYLNNGYCDMTIENMSLTADECKGCSISVSADAVYSINIDGVCLYEIKFTVHNPNPGTMWVTLTAPDGEGFFIGSTIMAPSGTSYPVLQFFPLNGFTGGSVFTEIDSQWEENLCYIKYSIDFPELCVSGRPAAPDPDTVTNPNDAQAEADMLIVAPNPASQRATIYYRYAQEGKDKTIEIFDTLGRPLTKYNANSTKGNFHVDCSLYAGGQYLIVMKAAGKIVKTSRMIVENR